MNTPDSNIPDSRDQLQAALDAGNKLGPTHLSRRAFRVALRRNRRAQATLLRRLPPSARLHGTQQRRTGRAIAWMAATLWVSQVKLWCLVLVLWVRNNWIKLALSALLFAVFWNRAVIFAFLLDVAASVSVWFSDLLSLVWP